LPESVDHGFGLYYIGKDTNLDRKDAYRLPRNYKVSKEDISLNSKNRLLRYDDQSNPDFNALNEALWELEKCNEDDYDESLTLYDWLTERKLNPSMLKMGEGGFANTLCANSNELSLKQAIKWSRIWHQEPGQDEEEDSDFTFVNSFSCLIDHLKEDLQIDVNTPIQNVDYNPEEDELTAVGDKQKKGKENLIKITTKEGIEYQSRNVVMTASPHVIQNKIITFQPTPLPDEIEEAYSWVKMNPVIKVRSYLSFLLSFSFVSLFRAISFSPLSLVCFLLACY
jgi:hypothetical protein